MGVRKGKDRIDKYAHKYDKRVKDPYNVRSEDFRLPLAISKAYKYHRTVMLSLMESILPSLVDIETMAISLANEFTIETPNTIRYINLVRSMFKDRLRFSDKALLHNFNAKYNDWLRRYAMNTTTLPPSFIIFSPIESLEEELGLTELRKKTYEIFGVKTGGEGMPSYDVGENWELADWVNYWQQICCSPYGSCGVSKCVAERDTSKAKYGDYSLAMYKSTPYGRSLYLLNINTDLKNKYSFDAEVWIYPELNEYAQCSACGLILFGNNNEAYSLGYDYNVIGGTPHALTLNQHTPLTGNTSLTYASIPNLLDDWHKITAKVRRSGLKTIIDGYVDDVHYLHEERYLFPSEDNYKGIMNWWLENPNTYPDNKGKVYFDGFGVNIV